ncbi:MAG: acyltransferase family protein [Methylococcales bacterium]|nr:acyltransferase family protein [Methylococcales bacterium]MDP3840702.1 acyltransferase family protein [Methylococcales bacterium]
MRTDTPFASRKPLSHLKYRADIDGLRAIAVLSVVIFHAFPNMLKGGFIGVDIFFIISGFLISTIIFSNLESDNFSFVEFYSRRIKRIFPALLLVLLACFAAGWFVLLADEYKQLGKHIAGGAGFVSNFLFWQESGYFDNAADTKPLLHLWSLGIEEQFYIVWPLLLWFAWQQRLNLLTITLTVLIISFALNISKVHSEAVAAFYSPQTRFWELLTGSVLAYVSLYKQNLLPTLRQRLDSWLSIIICAEEPDIKGNTLRSVQSLLGMMLIAVGMMVITKEKAFPGWWAVLPTMGAVLIISAGLGAWFNRAILANKVLVWFGLISFPLYLWHWPLLSFARIMEGDKPSQGVRLAAIVISVVLAWLTYKLIEKPIRFGNHSKAKTIILFVLILGIGGAGYYDYKHDGLGFRLKDRQEYSEYFENSAPEQKYFKKIGLNEKWRSECDFFDLSAFRAGHLTWIPVKEINHHCFERNNNYSNTVFIWGDSHAEQLYFGLKNHLPSNWQILQVASSGCVASLYENSLLKDHVYCTQSNQFALKTIQETKPNVVIIAQVSGHSIDNFNQITEKLKSYGVKKIIFIGPTPHWTSDLPKIILTKLWINTPTRTYKGIDKDILAQNALLQANFKQTDTAILVNLIDFFCNKDGCLTYIGDDKKTGITSFDYSHLTPIASDYLAKNLLVDVITGNPPKNQ